MENERKLLKVGLLLTGLFLCIALLPGLPAVYFSVLRWVVCAVMVYTAFTLSKEESFKAHIMVLAVLATLFNPLIPVHLTHSLWTFIHLATALYFSILAKKI